VFKAQGGVFERSFVSPMMKHVYLLSAIGVVSVMAPARGDTNFVVFQPHRAIYDISLVDTVPGSGVAGMTGRMVYELNGSDCEGYTQNLRFVTVMTNQEGEETVNDLRNSSWESTASKSYRFSTSQYQNDILADSSQGDATGNKTRTATSVELTKPVNKRLPLPPDTYFPIEHAVALISSAKAGRTFFKANLYDGSERGEKYYLTSAVIGKKYTAGARAVSAAMKGGERLLAVESWPVTISYFEVGKDKEDSTPTYELHFRYFENGITSDLKIDYGEFEIQGSLKDVTYLEAAKCPAAAR
jgi:hypothetical protein